MEGNVTKGVKKYQSGKYDGIIVQGRAAVPWMLLGPFAAWRYISPRYRDMMMQLMEKKN